MKYLDKIGRFYRSPNDIRSPTFLLNSQIWLIPLCGGLSIWLHRKIGRKIRTLPTSKWLVMKHFECNNCLREAALGSPRAIREGRWESEIRGWVENTSESWKSGESREAVGTSQESKASQEGRHKSGVPRGGGSGGWNGVLWHPRGFTTRKKKSSWEQWPRRIQNREHKKQIFDHFFLHHVVFNNNVLIWMLVFSHEIIILAWWTKFGTPLATKV